MTSGLFLAGNIPAGGMKSFGAGIGILASGGDIWSQKKT